MEYAEDWSTGRNYFKQEALEEQKNLLIDAA